MSCRECKFWKPEDWDEGLPISGFCHRNSPKPTYLTPHEVQVELSLLGTNSLPKKGGPKPEIEGFNHGWAMQVWPGTFSDDFCGDYVEGRRWTPRTSVRSSP